MKNSKYPPAPRHMLDRELTSETKPDQNWDQRRVLVGLMVPMLMMLLNLSMFGIALPTIRGIYGMQAAIWQPGWLSLIPCR